GWEGEGRWVHFVRLGGRGLIEDGFSGSNGGRAGRDAVRNGIGHRLKLGGNLGGDGGEQVIDSTLVKVAGVEDDDLGGSRDGEESGDGGSSELHFDCWVFEM